MELFNVVSIDEAKNIVYDSFEYEIAYESINVSESVGRICFQDIKATCNIPEFRRSTVDGYAVNSKDMLGASETIPSILFLKDEVYMGKIPSSHINIGDCIYVPTGGMIPDGADSVVMIEYTDKLDEQTVLLYSPVAPGENIIQIGEDISRDACVIKKGDKLRPYEIGVLASIGIEKISVYKKPKVAVISTGDEVVPSESIPKLGEIRDTNTDLLCSLLLEDGAEPVRYGIIKDSCELLSNSVYRAITECDIVLISGGSSVGKKDHTLSVIDSQGEILVHGIAIKPGKPTIIGKCNGKIVFGLPGHPFACSVIYRVLVSRYINKITNRNEKEYGISALMSINYHKAKGREEYLPVELERYNDKIIAKPVFGKSGLITVFSQAWGYIRIEKNVEGIKQGQMVEVYRL